MKKRSIERKLLVSILSFVLCCAMLIGMTYAWFTVSVQSDDNVIKVGSFDATVWFHNTYISAETANAEASNADPDAGQWVRFEGSSVFNDVTFIPGDEIVRYVKYENGCDYPVKFDLVLPKDAAGTYIQSDAADDFEIYTAAGVTETVTTANMTRLNSLAAVENAASESSPALILSQIVAAGEKAVIAVGVKLPTTYSDISAVEIEEIFKLRVIATQYNVAHEESSVTTTSVGDLTLTSGSVTVVYPSAPVAEYLLTVIDNGTQTNVETSTETLKYDISLTKDGAPVSTSANTYTIRIDVGPDAIITGVRHKGVPVTDYTYDAVSGILTFVTDSFSPFEVDIIPSGTIVANTEELLDAIAAGGYVQLANDIVFTAQKYINIAAGNTVTIDLNGYTLSVQQPEGKTGALITNQGTLTIEDSKGTGVIHNSVDHPDMADIPGYANNTITNNGILTVNAGTIENFGSGYACFAIDNQTNGSLYNPVLTINGGTIKQMGAYHYAVRMFCNSTTNVNAVTVNGGTIEGGYAFWMQYPNDKANKASLTINGGTFNANDGFSLYAGGNTADVSNVEVVITGGEFNGEGAAFSGVKSGTTYKTMSITGGTYGNRHTPPTSSCVGYFEDDSFVGVSPISDMSVANMEANGYTVLNAVETGHTYYHMGDYPQYMCRDDGTVGGYSMARWGNSYGGWIEITDLTGYYDFCAPAKDTVNSLPISDGYALSDNGNGTWTVVAE